MDKTDELNYILNDESVDIVKALGVELTDELGDDTFATLAEAPLTTFFDENVAEVVLQKLPLVKYTYFGGKAVLAIKDVLIMKTFVKFIKEFRENRHSELSMRRYKKALDNKEKWVTKLLENLIQLLTRLDTDEKIKYIQVLFSCFLEETIDWTQYNKYTVIVERLFLEDLKYLEQCCQNNMIQEDTISGKWKEEGRERPTEIEVPHEYGSRLQSLGLVYASYMGRLSDFSEINYMATETGVFLMDKVVKRVE